MPVLAVLLVATLACARSQSGEAPFWAISRQDPPTAAAQGAAATLPPWGQPPRRTPGAPILTPTPDAPHALPKLRTRAEQYTVQPGDTLGLIANRYGIGVEQIVVANQIANPDYLEVGQPLTIPAPTPQKVGPDFKILPDSELINGPYSVLFDVAAFVKDQGGYLASYHEEIEDQSLTGAQVVEKIAREYSVNPRLLLAVLEYQSKWVTGKPTKKAVQDYPMGVIDVQRKGLFRQLAWAANNLNRGYYLWRSEAVASWILADGNIVPAAPTINAGTAGVQNMFAVLYNRATWEKAVSPEGLFATYNALFGYPFDYALEPLLPQDLFQPVLQLPFEDGVVWYFTGGPHGAWGDGSAWGALDFAPPGEAVGCVESEAWVTAVADGLVVRAENGAVVLDLDGDGLEQTGWAVLYMHVESDERVQIGAYLKAGDRIGHPSCEGGVSSGTHVHVARKYNGEWLAADRGIPFVMDGWIASGAGKEYDGYLKHGVEEIEAYAGIAPNNGIAR